MLLLCISEVSRQNEIRKTKLFEQRDEKVFILHSLYVSYLRKNLAPSYTYSKKEKYKKFQQLFKAYHPPL